MQTDIRQPVVKEFNVLFNQKNLWQFWLQFDAFLNLYYDWWIYEEQTDKTNKKTTSSTRQYVAVNIHNITS